MEYRIISSQDCVFEKEGDGFRNLRVSPGDVEELKNSMEENGFLLNMPISVIPHPTRSGKYLVRNGSRRIKAAKLAGITEVPALIGDDSTDVELIVASVLEDGQRPLPYIVLDKNYNVIGGMAWAVSRLLDSGRNEYEVALQTGLDKQLVASYRAICTEPVNALKQMMAQELLTPTAYYRIKTLSIADKIVIVDENPNGISVNQAIRIAQQYSQRRERDGETSIKEAYGLLTRNQLGQEQDFSNDELELHETGEGGGLPSLKPQGKDGGVASFVVTNAILITQAIDRLRAVTDPSPTDRHMLMEVRSLVNAILEE